MPYPDDLISLDLDAVTQALAHSELLKDAPPEVLRRVQDECVPMALPAGDRVRAQALAGPRKASAPPALPC